MNIDALFLSYLALGIALFSFLGVSFLWVRLSKFTQGEGGRSLQGTIISLVHTNKERDIVISTIKEELSRINGKLLKDITGIGLVRFNAFQEQGGNQSFSLALLDRNGNGVIVSSIYTRERASVYAREVKNYHSIKELLPEEKHALEDAKKEHNA